MKLPIKDFDGYLIAENGIVFGKNGKEMKPSKDRAGYMRVILRKNNKSYAKLVHRLVAETFLPNPDGLPEVNHKDEDKSNNGIGNLEWCTHKYNNNYGTKTQRFTEKMKKNPNIRKKVKCIDTGKVYDSIKDAAQDLKVFSGDISRNCRNVKGHKTCGGYRFEYV